MRVVDAHFHVWRQADLPWLTGPMQPRIFGPYEPIRRDYPMAEYLADCAGTGVEKSVYVQANWPVERAEAEVAWVESVALETGWPHAIVGYADMTAPDVRPALDRLARYPRMRGVRQQFHWHGKPLYRFAADPELCRNPIVQKNVARLADYGWAFDLQVFAAQMAGAAELARACPGVTFVLQHAGMLEDLSESGRAAWRQGMTMLASEPNVFAKLSGFGTFIQRNDPLHIGWLISETVRLFGAVRCLYGSNFPIEKLWTGYGALIGAHRQGSDGLSQAEQTAIFHDTACRVYRL
ncbi:MAG: amidohydrolase family protein [Methylocystis sp.]|nr:amidohydrolase family protein [Methylocystis sp.]MCA3585402.1 amidohydrolase family protein [Methylocystis sp.]MCA3587763.1 amidohydrolase family protein [Methylocystis sp.]MCA3593373.1 amidohydrolase family protein [Methylocystis sp.]